MWIVTAAVVVVAVAAIVVFAVFMLRRASTRSRDGLAAALAGDAPLQSTAANCLGVSSGQQLRGAGMLALTKSELVFALGVPRRVLRIPIGRVAAVEVTGRFQRPGFVRASPRPMLAVDYISDSGPSRVGWQVADAAGWHNAIEATRAGQV
jgi:hypothetical protein